MREIDLELVCLCGTCCCPQSCFIFNQHNSLPPPPDINRALLSCLHMTAKPLITLWLPGADVVGENKQNMSTANSL